MTKKEANDFFDDIGMSNKLWVYSIYLQALHKRVSWYPFKVCYGDFRTEHNKIFIACDENDTQSNKNNI